MANSSAAAPAGSDGVFHFGDPRATEPARAEHTPDKTSTQLAELMAACAEGSDTTFYDDFNTDQDVIAALENHDKRTVDSDNPQVQFKAQLFEILEDDTISMEQRMSKSTIALTELKLQKAHMSNNDGERFVNMLQTQVNTRAQVEGTCHVTGSQQAAPQHSFRSKSLITNAQHHQCHGRE